ncbi:MAG: hypothetical protein L0220_22670 [Acidobacteria bacterium]|nr:hypothetical protein [Acidobacteriota bacterium]
MLLVGSMAVTFALLRVFLHISPNTDLNIGSYNIHHLFTGLLLIAAGGVPLAISHGTAARNRVALIIFGIGLGMSLDEWIFLIATDGSNDSYLLPVSFWGGVIVISLACVFAVVVQTRKCRTGK